MRGQTITAGHNRLAWLLSMLLAFTTLVSASVDPGEDFSGYAEEMARREQEERAYDAKLSAHEQWRQTTWAGFAVRKIQGIGQHLKPFVMAIQDALDQTVLEDGSKSPAKILAYIGIRMLFVMALMMIIYVGGKVSQLVIGGDFEVVEEVVIVHEHETEEEAAKARASTTRGKRKKQKAS